ncbi:PTS transporter subunit EIIC [Enterococcus hulanensis]|uniref:PTS transporter subunit EIIC n=1 Tax=Enterococcus hulanensis TaxID=2559929 RepID=UPI001A904BE5|nr:PTS transporter subunit EIIC [Enterococcus hulanensis]MBO0458156.1 PTS transporter subunit EIIC [Enterococcus hulanensis]
MDYKEIGKKIIADSGGVENISSITHCSTRLRLFIKDKSKVNQDQIQATKPVLGVVFPEDELQIVLGQNLIPVYDVVTKEFESSAKGNETSQSNVEETESMPQQKAPKKEDNKKAVTRLFNKGLAFVSAAVTPMIPGLVSGGMLKVFLLLTTLVLPSFEASSTYNLLNMLADVPFYFMPIFVAYGASAKLGGTPLYSMAVSAALVYPTFMNAVADGTSLSLLSIPVTLVKYNSTLLPALLISIFAYYAEKFFTKIVPGIIRPVFVGMLTITVTYILGVTVMGPLGDIVGSYVVNIFLWSSENLGPFAVGILAACMPWLVMTGMHHAVTPFMVQAIADPGYDVLFRPAYLLHNMAEGGACLGVALRAKDRKLKAECFSLAVGCILAGVTEPAIYGINLRLKRPMYGVMAGGALGGIVAGLMGATAYVYGYSTILAIPIFQNTIIAIVTAIIVSIVSACIITMVIGFDEELVL